MYFQSAGFLFLFLPLTLALLLLAPKGKPRTLLMVVLSYLFYSGASPAFIVILWFSSITDFVVSHRIATASDPTRRKYWLALSLVINLGLLACFKYGAMITNSLSQMGPLFRVLLPDPAVFETFLLPPGISFYTFQSLSYSIDVYRGQVAPTKDVWGFLAYVSYLPQLIAGPIERFQTLYPQLNDLFLKRTQPNWSAGFDRIAVGVIQKLLIADSCGRIVDSLLDWNVAYGFLAGWTTALAFGMQIYYDFTAYTNMAIGVSMLFGIRLSENFNSPYKARNIQEFWRRWHMTLSFWFRDYLYISLGGSRYSTGRTALNLMLTFVLCGLWHGAGLNFMTWGLGHGLLIIGFHMLKHTCPNLRLPTMVSVLITFLLVHFLWVVFRVSDPIHVMNLWQGMLGLSHLGLDQVLPWDIVFVVAVVIATWGLPNCAQRWPGKLGASESAAIWAVSLFAVVNSPQIHQFIYFQF